MAADAPEVAIVGGGAAGLATAVFLARERPGTSITVLDGARTLGAKILISGGGRCNVTNRSVGPADFNGGPARFVSRVLHGLPVPDTVAFFGRLGVPLHEERWGKLFPDSNRARDVLEALTGACREAGVRLVTSARVTEVRRVADAFELETSGGRARARCLVLATGGLSVPRTGSDGVGYQLARALGHSIAPTTPALVPLLLDGDLHEGLAGVSHEVRAQVAVARAKPRHFQGPMLWTHHGVSGPAVLDASRHVLRHRLEGRSPILSVGLVPEEPAAVGAWLKDAARTRPRAAVASVLGERLPASLGSRLAALAAADGVTMATLSRDTRRALVRLLTTLELPVRDSRGYDHAEVTAGGVALPEIDPATMASRLCPGLFLVGEILDVDGRLGGFNFQWAWASARAAARGIAASLA